jgi:putative NADPH-quinone reductase
LVRRKLAALMTSSIGEKMETAEKMNAGVDTRKKIQLIWAHPRSDSLTARVVAGIRQEADAQGWVVEELDLYRCGFDPVLREEDEPDWASEQQVHSAEATALAQSLDAVDHIVVVFPVWWYAVPAMLKGYIDRVWNYGLVYGDGKRIPASSIRWVALVGGAQAKFEAHGWDQQMKKLLNDGIAAYCGVSDSTITFLYNTIAFEEATDDIEQHHAALIGQASALVSGLV